MEKSDYINIYYTLITIRTQLYCCWYTENLKLPKYTKNVVKYNIDDEKKYLFKDALKIVNTDCQLNSIVNFTLCYLYRSYDIKISSYYFQQTLQFLKKDPLTKIQIEYVFTCLVAYWQKESNILNNALNSFIRIKEESKNDILFYFSQDVKIAYFRLIKSIKLYGNKELQDFFKDLLEQIKKNNVENILTVEALWKNFEFENADINEKNKLKNEYETYWNGKENIFPYSSALYNLLILDNTSDKIKNKIFNFLTNEDLDYNEYSIHLLLACLYLEECFNERSKEQDTKCYTILEIIEEQIETWLYKNNLSNMERIYYVLYNYTENKKYKEALAMIRFKLSHNLFEDKISISALDFFCNLCNIWGKNIINYNKISIEKYYEILKYDNLSKKKYLTECIKAPDVFINSGTVELINSEFLLINDILDTLKDYNSNIIDEFQELIGQCEQSAEINMNKLIDLIIANNQDYTGHILKFQEQWEMQLVVDDEEDEE